MKNSLRLVLLIVCGTVLGLNVYLANAKSLMGNQMPMPFGYGVAVVLSGSMEPALSVGDLILLKETDAVQVEDIVVFQDVSSLVVHRVVDIDENMITTKGDANNVSDDPMDASLVKGKVFMTIPGVGHLVNFLKTPIGTLLTIILAIALIEIPRRIEMQKDDEEREKLIEEINQLKKEIYNK